MMVGDMASEIVIHTGARLHFGILSYRPDRPGHFGGAGLMIECPGFVLALSRDETDRVDAPAGAASRARRFLRCYRENCPRQPPHCRIHIRSEIPAHVGLGSGTQLALAIGRGLAELTSEENPTVLALARRVGRGARSAVGIHGFAQGGFLIDGGQRAPGALGELAARVDFPADWRLLLVRPGRDTAGLCGASEEDTFKNLPAMPAETAGRLNHLAREELLPAVREADFSRFSRSIFDFGRIAGEFFSPVQGGTFADAQMAQLVSHLRKTGIEGVGQTSWGPTLFILLENQTAAEQLRRDLAAHPRFADCRFHVAGPFNQPAGKR